MAFTGKSAQPNCEQLRILTAHCLFCKVVTPREHFYVIIGVLTVEHLSISVCLKSHLQQILTLKQKAAYGLTWIEVPPTHQHGLGPAVGTGHTYLTPAALDVLWAQKAFL